MRDPTPDWSTDTQDLATIGDFWRWATSRFSEAGLHFGHGTDSASDEAAWLIAHALHLSLPLASEFHGCRVTPSERRALLGLFRRRIDERLPAAYLTGEAWFAGLAFAVDPGVMIPRSPIGELIERHFEPWLDPEHIASVLDLCAGSGCIGLATAAHLPGVRVDLAELSEPARSIAARNLARHALAFDLDRRVRLLDSDLFAAVRGCRYDLILSNPPYVGRAELETLPAEYRHEPVVAFAAGEQGLDIVLRILREAAGYLSDQGALIVEVGNSAQVLQERLPEVPFLWLELERGGEGVFLLHREQLMDYHQAFVPTEAPS